VNRCAYGLVDGERLARQVQGIGVLAKKRKIRQHGLPKRSDLDANLRSRRPPEEQ
jgi:hypothetical protein